MSNTSNGTPVNEAAESSTTAKRERTWTEQIEVAGNELVDRVKKLIAEGNVRRVIIRNDKGDSLLEIPLTAGVVVGGALALAYPILAALGALAALIANFKVDVVRTEK